MYYYVVRTKVLLELLREASVITNISLHSICYSQKRKALKNKKVDNITVSTLESTIKQL